MSLTPSKQAACPPRRARFARGLKLGFPIFLGYVPAGMAFGIIARDVGFTTVQTVLCSAGAIAGAGQFIALSLLNAGATALTVVIATSVVNLRYVLFGATLSPYVPRTPLVAQSFLAFTLTDETFAVNIDDNRRGTADSFSMAGVGAVAWVGWVLGTAAGALAGGLIHDPGAWGVQFAMPAMFTALLVAQAENRRLALIGVLAGALTIGAMLVVPGHWYLIVGPMVAATIGAVTER